MTDRDIKLGNPMIAEFIQGFIPFDGKWQFLFQNQGYPINTKSLSYHDSWEWLMTAINKIELIYTRRFNVTIKFESCSISDEGTEIILEPVGMESDENAKIEMVWRSVIRFIQWCKQNEISIPEFQKDESQYSYYKYLNSPEWTQLKIDLFEFRGKNCERCGSDFCIEVHHKTYKNLYHEEPEDLEILCRRCHKTHHRRINKHKMNKRLMNKIH